MGKSILVLEENSVVHGLVASALDMDGLTLHHEFNPAKYVDRARMLQPDLILFSNADQGNNYAILKQLKTLAGPNAVPLVLLANSRDRVDPSQLKSLNVAALVRKPFEASELQLQVSKHLDLIDLVGSAYEYSRSQSVREEGINPLTQLDVIDPEVTAMMQAGTRPGPALPETPVPDVDFSAELSAESATARRETRQTHTATTVTHTETVTRAETVAKEPPARGGLEVLDDGPVESFSAGAPEPLAGEDVLLDEGELLQSLGPDVSAPSAQPFEGMGIEELGPEDLLDEEAYEEATFAPAGVEQTIQPEPTAGGPAGPHLDQIEVELSEADLAFPEAEAPPFQPTAGGPAAAEAGELPLSVRRMMELRPAFSRAPDAAAREPEPLGAGRGEERISLGDEELDEAAILQATEHGTIEDLAPLDSSDPDLLGLTSSEEIDLESAEAEADLAPLSATPEQDDQDLTIDSDEEELILSSLEEEEPISGALELTREEREGLTEALDLEQDVFQAATGSVPTITTVTTAAVSERASTFFSETVTRTVAETPAPPAGVQPAARDAAGVSEAEAIVKADLAEMDLLDDLGLQEPVTAAPREEVPAREEVPEEEQFLSATFQNVQPAARGEGKFGLELPTDELLEVPVPEDLASATMETEAEPQQAPEVALDEILPGAEPPLDAGLTEETWQAEPAGAPETDMSMFETAATVETETSVETMEGAAEETTTSTGVVSESFEDAFAALKEEIESNPQGERLDDVLRMEQLQDEVAKIAFTIPQHEHALARGMPLYAMPGAIPAQPAGDAARPRQAPPGMDSTAGSAESTRLRAEETRVTSTVTTTVATRTAAAVQRTQEPAQRTQEPAQRAQAPVQRTQAPVERIGAPLSADSTRRDLGLAATGSLLDESARARLGQLLDEIITTSVRKAVREEMPRLLERIAQESPPSASV